MRTILQYIVFSHSLHRKTLISLFVVFPYMGIGASETASSVDQESKQHSEPAAVECLLPSQLRSLGEEPPRLAPRRQVTVTVQECAERGGEIVESTVK